MSSSTFSTHLKRSIRKAGYSVLRLLFRNKPVVIPVQREKVKKVLIMRYDRLGDMVVTTALFAYFKKHIPDVQIDVVASPINAGILAYDSFVKNIWVFDGTERNQFKALWRGFRMRKQLRAERYDIVLCAVFHKTTFAGLLANMFTGPEAVKCILGADDRNELYKILFSALLPHKESYYNSMAGVLLQLAGYVLGTSVQPEDLQYRIVIPPKAEQEVHNILSVTGQKPYIFVNISARRENFWGVNNSAELIHGVVNKFPQYVVVVSASPQDSQQLTTLQEHVSELSNVSCITPSSDIFITCELIKRSAMVITPDTAIVHIANAFGKKMVALYHTRADNATWRPIDDTIVLMAPPQRNVEAIPVADVFTAVTTALQQIEQH
jgi:ADP-heptose:LPS heptosyltransferase